MNWLRNIFGLSKPVVPTPKPAKFIGSPVLVDWDAQDVMELRKFLQNQTGKKLIEICGAHSLRTAMKECSGDKGAPEAAGMDAMLRFQFNLASDRMLQQISGDSPANESSAVSELSDTDRPLRSF
jgi:hypothetical protein